MKVVRKKNKKSGKWRYFLLLSPIILFLLVGILIYIPPIQQFIVNQVAKSITEECGVNVSVGKVRLAFPLDLAVHDVLAIEHNDTLADIRAMRLDVRVLPLAKGKVFVDGLEIYDAKVNSGNWIPDVYLRGRIGKFAAETHGVDLKKEEILLDYAELEKSNLFIALSDTAKVEPSEPSLWKLLAQRVTISKTDLQLSLPEDTMRIAFHADNASLEIGKVDLGASNYHVDRFRLHGGAFTYATRSLSELCGVDSLLVEGNLPICSSGIQPIPNTAFRTSDSILWEGFSAQSKGLDPNYIEIRDWSLDLENIDFLNDGKLGVRIREFLMAERSGLKIDHLAGDISLSQGILNLNDFALHTPSSMLEGKSSLLLDSILLGKNDYGHLALSGTIGCEDVKILGQGIIDSLILRHWPASPLRFDVDITGTSRNINVDTLMLDWPHVANLKMAGEVLHPYSETRMGELDMDFRTYNLAYFHALMALEKIPFRLPKGLTAKVNAQMNGDHYVWDTQVKAEDGEVDLKGNLNLKSESYRVNLVSRRFPLQSFMPDMEIGPLSAHIEAEGHGFDIHKKNTQIQMNVALDTLCLQGMQMGKMLLAAYLEEGRGNLNYALDNDIVEALGDVNFKVGDMYDFKMTTDFSDINLARLMGEQKQLSLGTVLSLEAYSNNDFTSYGLSGDLTNLRVITKDMGIPIRDFFFGFDSTPDTTLVSAASGDMEMNLSASGNLEKIIGSIEYFLLTFQNQMLTQELDQTALKEASPILNFHLETGGTNPVVNVVKELGYSYKKLYMDLKASPQKGLVGDFRLSSLVNGDLLLDTVMVQLQQDTTGLVANAWVKNFKKRNPTKFEASLKSYLLNTGAGIEMKIRNQDDIVGMDFGVLSKFVDEGMYVHLYPENPVIAFRDFTINKDNYLYWGKDSTIQADITMLASDGTGLGIYSQPSDSVNDLTFSLSHLDLGQIAGAFPFIPSVEGLLNGDFHIVDDHENLSAMATLSAQNLVLEGASLGNFDIEAIYLPQDSTKHQANVFISSNGAEILALDGLYSLDDNKEKFEGNAELLDFPLELLNGFLVGTDLAMSGKAIGSLTVNGDMSKPDLNGKLRFEDAHMYSEVYGFDFRMDNQQVLIENNQMLVKDYAMYSSQSNNPLLLNGKLDMRTLSNVNMDFSMLARNFELINAKKQSKSLVFGKVYADFEGYMKGSLQDLTIRGKLSILDRTDMTYILKDSPLTVDDRLHDLVEFVDFESVPEVEKPEIEPTNKFDMTLMISINDAAIFHCNLSEDGANYVDLEGGGDLTLRLTQQGDMRLTGRFTANSGEMKYSLPVIPLKTFKLVRGSFVDFTGDVLNPTLSIAAKERMKAMVTENDQPRSVAFDVGVSITQPLDRMGLEFTIEAPEDLTVQNQLAAMTKAERGKAAVGMLATGMYLTDEGLNSSTSGFKASNALTSFLQSEIQNIAGSALKTIDVTIGMENNTSVTGATTTDYSFQFAKRFWGNRISVIIGGKVSTGAEAENSAESFIDNVAVEYRLDKTASRYVRVFYERSFQDPLEGELTKTGAGLVLRRKSDRLGDLFIFRNRDSKKKSDKK